MFGTYLQNGVCVVSCDNATIGDSDTQECRDILGELIVLVISSMVHRLCMTCVAVASVWCISRVWELPHACLLLLYVLIIQLRNGELC